MPSTQRVHQLTATLTIPAGPEDLTADWLTLALRQGGRVGHVTVVSYTAAPLAENPGFYGQLARVRLEVGQEGAGAPQSLIAKFSSATPEIRQRSLASYAREVCFYQHLAHQTALPTPRCYYYDINPQIGDHVLLLQDLAPARSGSRVAGCSLDQAQLAVDQIANFHATWWETPQLNELRWLVEDAAKPDASALQAQYEQWWPLFLQQANDHLPGTIKAMGACLGQQRAAIRQHIFHAAPRTLIHRDYQLDNLIFGTPPGGMPFAVVDWQFLSRGRGVWDVAYFLSESLLPDDRRAAEMALLKRYHHILLKQGVQAYSFDECLYDYRVALLQRFSALVSTIAAMPFSEEQRRIHRDILLPRNIAALLDHDAAALLPSLSR